MELHQLRYFCAVAETGSFSRAAEQSHVSQPSLSQQILKLEDELGARLFDRLGRSVRLTELGKTFLPRARAFLPSRANSPRFGSPSSRRLRPSFSTVSEPAPSTSPSWRSPSVATNSMLFLS